MSAPEPGAGAPGAACASLWPLLRSRRPASWPRGAERRLRRRSPLGAGGSASALRSGAAAPLPRAAGPVAAAWGPLPSAGHSPAPRRLRRSLVCGLRSRQESCEQAEVYFQSGSLPVVGLIFCASTFFFSFLKHTQTLWSLFFLPPPHVVGFARLLA